MHKLTAAAGNYSGKSKHIYGVISYSDKNQCNQQLGDELTIDCCDTWSMDATATRFRK